MLKRKSKYDGIDHSYDLFRSTKIKVCMPVFGGVDPRNVGFASSGARHIIEESGLDVELVNPISIDNYDIALISMLSVQDSERIIREIPKRSAVKIIAGGQGCISIKPLIDIIDCAHFGRAEGMVADIINMKISEHTWTREDASLNGKYQIRRPQYKLKNESTIGCRNRCMYCQYTYTRPYINAGHSYSAGLDMKISEEDWRGLNITNSGRYTTALDGWTDETRSKVLKHVKNKDIIEKMKTALSLNLEKPIVLKIFQIVGYPWENEQTVRNDIIAFADVLREAEKDATASSSRILIMFCLTPFSPEPLTPMQFCEAKLIDWRNLVDNLPIPRQVYKGKKIEAFILPQIPGPYTLAKRVSLQRGIPADLFLDAVKFTESQKKLKAKGMADTFISIAGDYCCPGDRASMPHHYLTGTTKTNLLGKCFDKYNHLTTDEPDKPREV